jgi:hypothetical protein
MGKSKKKASRVFVTPAKLSCIRCGQWVRSENYKLHLEDCASGRPARIRRTDWPLRG